MNSSDHRKVSSEVMNHRPNARPQMQKLVMSLIYDDVKAGRDCDPQKFSAIHRELVALGCDCGVLACTELSVYRTYHGLPDYYLDAMDVLAAKLGMTRFYCGEYGKRGRNFSNRR